MIPVGYLASHLSATRSTTTLLALARAGLGSTDTVRSPDTL
jgi:hypothetical protein